MSYTLTSTSRAAYRGGVDTSTAYAGYEITPKLSRVVRYAFTAPAQGVSALSFSVANVARAYKYNNFNGIRFAVTTSDASHRNAVEAGGFEGHAAPVAGNGTSYTVSGSCEVNIAPGAAFYLWFFPAEYAHCLWSFANLGSFTVTCEAGAASFASIDSAVETLGTLSASAGTATAAMTHRLTLCDGEAARLTSEPFTGSVSLTVPRAIFAAYPTRTALALTARLQAYSDAACTMPYGAPAEAAVSVTADAGMAPKLPAAAVTSSIVNSGTVAAAATGQSRVRFRLDSTKFDFSDAPGASAASVTVNGTALAAPAYEYLSPVLTANSTKFDIVLTDTRGLEPDRHRAELRAPVHHRGHGAALRFGGCGRRERKVRKAERVGGVFGARRGERGEPERGVAVSRRQLRRGDCADAGHGEAAGRRARSG